MKRNNLTAKQRLDVELAEKSSTSSIVFVIAAFLFYFTDFRRGIPREWLTVSCFLVVAAAVFRYLGARNFLKKDYFDPKSMRLVKWAVFINALGWAVVFSQLRSFIYSGDNEAFIMFLAVSAMCASSVITLASSRPLAWFFQAALLGPTIAIILYEYMVLGQTTVLGSGLFLIIFLIYLFRQTMDSEKQMLEKFGHEMSLEKSLEELKISNQRIIEETAKAQHSARLAAIGEMAGGIAHEINTPLAVMLSNIEFMESLYQENRKLFDETFEARSGKVKIAIERVSKIIKGLRSFAQQNDRQPKELVNLKTVIDETLDFCSEKMRQNGIELRYKTIPDTEVLCHSVQISQVLLNLINNSFYEVTLPEVKERWIELIVKIGEKDIKLSMIDSGRGVPLEYQTKLFQPFFTSKGVGKGTGLGLSISKGIMKDHGGDLFFDPSSPHTKFDMILPFGR